MPCRGEPLCSPFFCVVSGLSERKFRKWARINANNSLCHSEHLLLSFRTLPLVIPNASSCHSERSEESRPGKEKRFIAYALNDKLMVNGQWLIVMPGTRRIMYLENNH